MTVSIITRSLDKQTANAAYLGVCPDIVRTCAVPPGQYRHLVSSDPLTAGNELHALLGRMNDHNALSPTEKAYLPWIDAFRTAVRGLGVSKMDAEFALSSVGRVPGGVCDLLVRGGPQKRGVVEVKVLLHGTQEQPRGRDLAQLGSYARLIAGGGSFDHVWGAVAYIELDSHLVRIYGFKNARKLVTQTLELLRAA